MAFVFLIYSETLKVKVGRPACFLNPSNSTGLKLGLYSISHVPKNSSVFLFLNQFFIISSIDEFPSFALAISEIHI